MDDVLLFSNGNGREARLLLYILDIYGIAIGMKLNI
jgi:hypothetical protein